MRRKESECGSASRSLSARVRIYPYDRSYEFHLVCHRILSRVRIGDKAKGNRGEKGHLLPSDSEYQAKNKMKKAKINANNYGKMESENEKKKLFLYYYTAYKFLYFIFLIFYLNFVKGKKGREREREKVDLYK